MTNVTTSHEGSRIENDLAAHRRGRAALRGLAQLAFLEVLLDGEVRSRDPSTLDGARELVAELKHDVGAVGDEDLPTGCEVMRAPVESEIDEAERELSEHLTSAVRAVLRLNRVPPRGTDLLARDREIMKDAMRALGAIYPIVFELRELRARCDADADAGGSVE